MTKWIGDPEKLVNDDADTTRRRASVIARTTGWASWRRGARRSSARGRELILEHTLGDSSRALGALLGGMVDGELRYAGIAAFAVDPSSPPADPELALAISAHLILAGDAPGIEFAMLCNVRSSWNYRPVGLLARRRLSQTVSETARRRCPIAPRLRHRRATRGRAASKKATVHFQLGSQCRVHWTRGLSHDRHTLRAKIRRSPRIAARLGVRAHVARV